jgi:hypothetical protein
MLRRMPAEVLVCHPWIYDHVLASEVRFGLKNSVRIWMEMEMEMGQETKSPE